MANTKDAICGGHSWYFFLCKSAVFPDELPIWNVRVLYFGNRLRREGLFLKKNAKKPLQQTDFWYPDWETTHFRTLARPPTKALIFTRFTRFLVN